MAKELDLGRVKGEDGKTPVKGEDYFTEEEKAQMVQDVLDQLSLASGVSF